MGYDPSKYSVNGGMQNANQFRQKQMSDMTNEFVSKNPSTAAGSYFRGGQANNGLTSGGGMGQMVSESFDLDIMMPPDIASIDSDLSKSVHG